MRKQLYISLLAILALPLLTRAEEVIISDTTEIISDTIVAVEDSVPDWYVAPEIPEALRSPMRATASGCLTDSILTFNADSILTETTTYDYDAAGRTIRTTVWAYSSDGSRIGKSKTEYGFDPQGTQVYTAKFSWNTTANDWKGTEKSEFVYNEAHKMESSITYTWVNNTWLPSQALTYAYDAAGRETEFTTYSRNASANRLVPSKQRLQTWYNASKKTLEINYTAYSNGNWSAGNKKEYAYDSNGNQIEYTYYSSYSAGNWIGSTQEFWTYNASNKKTYYEKKTWSNGAWANTSKESWEFNAAGKQTLHEKYSGSGTDWTITLREISGYDAAGNTNLVENYSLSSNVWKGTKKEEYTFNSAKKKINTYKYKWVAADNAWVYNTWAVTDFDAAGNATETASYSWTNNAWKGTGTRTLQSYNSSKKVTEKITQTWPAGATDWVNATRTTTEYSGSKTLKEASFTWSNDDWTPSTRKDFHYNAAGQNDTTTTFATTGTDWIFSKRTIYTYDSKGNTILTHNASWDGSAWVMTTMSRLDVIYDAANRQLLNATYDCTADSVWRGIQKDTFAYTSTGKNLYTARYSSWANNDWVPSYYIEYVYDEADRKTLDQRFDWINNDWQGHYKYEYGYDAQGRQVITASYLNWNTSTNDWIGSTMYEDVYDANGRKSSQISYTWRNGGWDSLFLYTYQYDAAGHEILQLVQRYTNNTWENTDKYEKGYKGSTLVKDNAYSWASTHWQIYRRSELNYDADTQSKLRREVSGSWNNGVVISFTDNLYFYSCDAPASNGSQPRTPTEIEEIDENNGTYENNETNAQPFDPTQPTYNLSGQRVDPENYHGVVIQSGHPYLLP